MVEKQQQHQNSSINIQPSSSLVEPINQPWLERSPAAATVSCSVVCLMSTSLSAAAVTSNYSHHEPCRTSSRADINRIKPFLSPGARDTQNEARNCLDFWGNYLAAGCKIDVVAAAAGGGDVTNSGASEFTLFY